MPPITVVPIICLAIEPGARGVGQRLVLLVLILGKFDNEMDQGQVEAGEHL